MPLHAITEPVDLLHSCTESKDVPFVFVADGRPVLQDFLRDTPENLVFELLF